MPLGKLDSILRQIQLKQMSNEELEAAKAQITEAKQTVMFLVDLLARAQGTLEFLIDAVEKRDETPEAVKIVARTARQECDKINSELLNEMLENPIEALAVSRRMDHLREQVLGG